MYFKKEYNLLPFKNKRHLQHHLNYLFRTDGQQKWTNELTKRNMYIIEHKIYNFGPEKDLWILFKNGLEKSIKSEEADWSKMYMCRIECPDSKIFHFNEKMLNEMIEILDEVEAKADNEGLKFLCAVTHEDQKNNYVHFHMLFCNRKPYDFEKEEVADKTENMV